MKIALPCRGDEEPSAFFLFERRPGNRVESISFRSFWDNTLLIKDIGCSDVVDSSRIYK